MLAPDNQKCTGKRSAKRSANSKDYSLQSPVYGLVAIRKDFAIHPPSLRIATKFRSSRSGQCVQVANAPGSSKKRRAQL